MAVMVKKRGRPSKGGRDLPYAGGYWAKKLRALREAKGWNQKEASKNLGISQGNLSNLEAGANLPSGPLKELIKLLSQ